MGASANTSSVIAGVRTLFSLSGLKTTDSLASGVGAGLIGHASGHWVAVLHSIRSQAVASESRFQFYGRGSNVGHAIFSATTNASLGYRCYFTGPSEVFAPTYTIVGGDIGKWMLTWGVWDAAAGKLRLYPKNGTEQGTGTATALAPIPNTTGRTQFGLASITQNTLNWTAAIFGGDGFVPTPSEIAATDAALKKSLSVTDALAKSGLNAKCTHAWRVPNVWDPTVTTLSDLVGSETLTMVSGAASDLTLQRSASPLFAA